VEHGTGEGNPVAEAYANQVAYCRANAATITARVVEAIAAQLPRAGGNRFLERIRDWPGKPLADTVPLRTAAGLHALHLSGTEPAIAAIYRGEPADDVRLIRAAIDAREADLLPWLDSPPQTNEAGRSSNFVAGMLWLAGQGLPSRFECVEIGSSAGINLMLDRYRYDLDGVITGPAMPVMSFAPEWRGPPPPNQVVELVATRGCDVAPVDLRDPAQALRLKAYIWPEHTLRFERLEAAIAAAKAQAPELVEMNAANFVEAELAKPQQAGVTRVLMHSIVWQYVPQEQRKRVRLAMEAAGARATAERPLVWLALEANRTSLAHELTVQYWPGGEERVQLAHAHAHGAWIEWLGAPAASSWPEDRL
jgi:hypothetical protein